MKTKIILWIGVLFLLTAGAGCEKEGKVASEDVSTPQQQGGSDDTSIEEKEIPVELLETWKLAGFGNTAESTFKEAKPKDCKQCYTITFQKYGTITGTTFTNRFVGRCEVKAKTLHFEALRGSEFIEYFDGEKYAKALKKVTHFEILPNHKQLKLYYSDMKDFLLFYVKGNELPTAIPSELIGIWKLEGFGNTVDNTMKEAEPKDCEQCYTVTLREDGILTGHTSTNELMGTYIVNGRNFTMVFAGTEINELYDGKKYIDALNQVNQFEVFSEPRSMRLYYNGENNYLQFKQAHQLTGTRWQLAGIVDVKTGKIKPLAPKGAYWFKFISDIEAQGKSVVNILTINLLYPPFFNIETEVGDSHNGDAALFYRIIRSIESYTKEGNQLKFFYDKKQYYLLYKYSKS